MITKPIIDCHMHIYPSKALGREEKKTYDVWEYGTKQVALGKYGGDLFDALQAIRESGTTRAVVMSHLLVNIFNLRQKPGRSNQPSVGLEEDPVAEAEIAGMLHDSNVSICKLARNYPALVPFVIIDPHTMTADQLEVEFRELVNVHGARGVKLHPVLQQFFPNDKRMWPIYRTCSELGLPILSHSGMAHGSSQYAEPQAFSEVLKEFPRLKLILAHLGGAAWKHTLAVAREYQSACFDCSEIIEWVGAPSAPTYRELAQLIKDVGTRRVVMGTDFPWYDLDKTINLVKSLPLLSEEEKDGILGVNASRILDI